MNTITHILVGSAVFVRKGRKKEGLAAIFGAICPDILIFGLALYAFLMGIPQNVVWSEMYYAPGWQRSFAVTNSVFLYGALLLIGKRFRDHTLYVFSASALLHLVLDFPVHHDDGHPLFWPLSDWIFESPLSYWDTAHYAGFVMPVDIAIALVCVFFLFRRFRSRTIRILLSATAMVRIFEIFFLFRFFSN